MLVSSLYSRQDPINDGRWANATLRHRASSCREACKLNLPFQRISSTIATCGLPMACGMWQTGRLADWQMYHVNAMCLAYK